MRLTDAELKKMPEKTKRDPEAVELYKAHDFLDAYALHTERRIKTTGYKAAVGGGDNWEEHGKLQADFLKAGGLMPRHSLLEIGCGTGRLARQIAPYLRHGNYHGLDISIAAINEAKTLAEDEGWYRYLPEFSVGELGATSRKFDYIWAFSVFIHLPQDIMESVMRNAASVMHRDSQFFWAYVPEPKTYRSGVKQFRHTLEDYQRAAKSAGLTFLDIDNWIGQAGHKQGRWSGSQRVAFSRLIP